MKTTLKTLALLAVSTTLLLTSCAEEEGCTDPAAINFDSEAEKDCCCEYDAANGFTEITTDVTWTSDIIHELNGKVVVKDGGTLTIEPGTIIKAAQGDNSLAAALIIAQGGTLNAIGTAEDPIIMTTVLDNIELGQKSGSNLDENDKGKWGGLIVLGRAPISAEEGDDLGQIEGIPASETYGAYGGSDVNDNSGTIAYVSVRHGGIALQPGDEINGITFGGVGAGTTVHHIEVVGNDDDGIEFFGGTVDVDHALVAYQGDDAIDIDMNYDGTVENFLLIQDANSDAAMEIDGPENTLNDGLFALRNGMVVSTGGGDNIAANFKSKAQGLIENISFWGYSTYFNLRASYDENNGCAETDDAHRYYVSTGALAFVNLEFEGSSDLVNVYTSSESCPVAAGAQAAADTQFVSEGHITGASAPSLGADVTAFDGWSWASVNDKY